MLERNKKHKIPIFITIQGFTIQMILASKSSIRFLECFVDYIYTLKCFCSIGTFMIKITQSCVETEIKMPRYCIDFLCCIFFTLKSG